MSEPAVFKATYSDWRLIRGRKVVQVVFEIPLEAADSAYATLGGMPNPAAEAWCAIARLDPETASEPPAAKAASDTRMAQRAGMLCKDPVFWRFLNNFAADVITDAEKAAAAVRSVCEVKSRSEIKPNTTAGDRWDWLEGEFIVWRDAPGYADEQKT